jgi:hypothetical protein
MDNVFSIVANNLMESRGIQGNPGESRGIQGNPGESRGIQGNPVDSVEKRFFSSSRLRQA